MPKLKTQKNEYKMVSNIKCYTYLANLNNALRKKKEKKKKEKEKKLLKYFYRIIYLAIRKKIEIPSFLV